MTENESDSQNSSLSIENSCLICYNQRAYHCVLSCGHSEACFLCILKLRHVMNNKKCPFCKESSSRVLLTKEKNIDYLPLLDKEYEPNSFPQRPIPTWTNPSSSVTYILFPPLNIWIPSSSQDPLHSYLESIYSPHVCPICSHDEWKDIPDFNTPPSREYSFSIFKTSQGLDDHLKTQHQSFLCSICQENRPVFPCEQKTYSIRDLDRHIKRGNLKDDSPEFNGHPYCTFCKIHFYDTDPAYLHMEQFHERCSVCHNHGNKYQYYANYTQLFRHFESEHFLCRNPECLEKKYVHIYATKERLNLHAQISHSRRSSSNPIHFDSNKQSSSSSPGDNNLVDHPPRSSRNALSFSNQFLRSSSLEEDGPRVIPEHLADQMNRTFIQNIIKALGNDSSTISQFRTLSLQYRDDKISAVDYVTFFLDIFPKNTIQSIFSQLVALLQDKHKRDNLRSAYFVLTQSYPIDRVKTLGELQSISISTTTATSNNSSQIPTHPYQPSSFELDKSTKQATTAQYLSNRGRKTASIITTTVVSGSSSNSRSKNQNPRDTNDSFRGSNRIKKNQQSQHPRGQHRSSERHNFQANSNRDRQSSYHDYPEPNRIQSQRNPGSGPIRPEPRVVQPRINSIFTLDSTTNNSQNFIQSEGSKNPQYSTWGQFISGDTLPYRAMNSDARYSRKSNQHPKIPTKRSKQRKKTKKKKSYQF